MYQHIGNSCISSRYMSQMPKCKVWRIILQKDFVKFCGLNCIFLFLSPLRYRSFSGNNLVKSFEKSLNNLQGLWVHWRVEENGNPRGPVEICCPGANRGELEGSFTEIRNILHYVFCILHAPQQQHKHMHKHNKIKKKKKRKIPKGVRGNTG